MSVDIDVDAEMKQLLEDIPIGWNRAPSSPSPPPPPPTTTTNERGGAKQAVASQPIQADGEGGKARQWAPLPGAAHVTYQLSTIPLFRPPTLQILVCIDSY